MSVEMATALGAIFLAFVGQIVALIIALKKQDERQDIKQDIKLKKVVDHVDFVQSIAKETSKKVEKLQVQTEQIAPKIIAAKHDQAFEKGEKSGAAKERVRTGNTDFAPLSTNAFMAKPE